MFTVVIAEKEHLDAIKENHLFLEPFLKSREIAFCEWRPDETEFSEMVPTLEQTVSRVENWRAIVIATDEGLYQKNPFDLVEYKPPAPKIKFDYAPMDEPESDEVTGKALKVDLDDVTESTSNLLNEKLVAYLGKQRKAKFAAFEQAKEKPLTRLMTFLCEEPMVSSGRNHADEDPEFEEYLEENRKKHEIREQIRGTQQVECSLPLQIFCIARRTYKNPEYDIPVSWSSHGELQYSKFYDQNLYFDRMRYFVFDLLPKHHRNYTFDYIRFLYAVLILAGHEVPQGAIQKERVYLLCCENDEDALDKMLSAYESKLSATASELEYMIDDRVRKEKERLSDREANLLFGTNIPIPVIIDKEIDAKGIYANPREYHLSEDRPIEEEWVWKEQFQASKKTMRKLLKQPRRALKKASGDLHRLKDADVSRAMMLNEFQLEDVQERTDNEELMMVETDPMNLTDTSQYEKKIEKQDSEIKEEISGRMKKRTILLLSLFTLLLYLGGCVPLFLRNVKGERTLVGSAALILTCFGLMFVLLLAALFIYRKAMRRKIESYNEVMREFDADLNNALTQYSHYLSHAGNVLRGYSVLNYRENTEDTSTTEVRLLRKYVMDLKKTKAEVDDVFGKYITGKYDTTGRGSSTYEYDYLRGTDYEFPLPYTTADRTVITYIETGSRAEVPVRFVKSLTARREELYDE